MRSLGFHLLLMGSLATGVSALRVGLRGWYAEELTRAARKASAHGAEERESVWRRLRYIDVSQAELPDTLLQGVKWQRLQLTTNQAAALRTRLREVASYLQRPTFEDYYRLRTQGLRYRFVASGDGSGRAMAGTENTGALNGVGSPSAAGPPGPAETSPMAGEKEAIRSAWDRALRANGETAPPRITAISLESIAAIASQTNTIRSLMSGELAKGFTAYVVQPNPGFRYGEERSVGAEAGSQQTYFHMSFFAKVNGLEHAGPLYLSLQWLPQEETWALAGLITDNCLGMRTIF